MKVQVTVRSLHGISNLLDEATAATASVSFSGSFSTSRVSSSNISVHTGRPVVESEPSLQAPIVWAMSNQQPPHLVFYSNVRSQTPQTSLSFSNRTSMTEDDTNSFLWEEATAPEIVEFTVQLGSQTGLCYLKFFGNDNDVGSSFVLDLPVRGFQQDQQRHQPTLRVHVNVAKSTLDDDPPGVEDLSSSTNTDDSQERDKEGYYSRDLLTPTLLEQLQSENGVLDLRRLAQRNMEIHVRQQPQAKSSCGVISWNTLRHAVAACHPGFNHNDDLSTIATRDSWH